MSTQADHFNRLHAFLAFAGYLAFVVYGSLIPFDFNYRSFDQALYDFERIQFLDLGIGSRADWVANIILYIPLAFLACVWLLGIHRGGVARYLALIPVWLTCLSVAVAVEFTQQYFAPRTVSLNDLLAEGIGSAVGVTLWAFGRERIAALATAFATGGRASVRAALVLFSIAFVALALFPYDFILSAGEWAWKLRTGNNGWLMGPICVSWIHCGARLAGDLLAVLPIGLLLALLHPGLALRRLLPIALGVGAGIEVLQLLIASGSSQGASALARAAGLLAGVALGNQLRRRTVTAFAGAMRRLTPFLVLPYLVTLAALVGWFSSRWLALPQGWKRLAETNLTPFYFHYYTSEPVAMASLIANSAMYAPVGLAIWARRMAAGKAMPGGAKLSAALASLLALGFELSRPWLAGRHADFTNLLIGAAAAAATYLSVDWLRRVLAEGMRQNPTPAPQAAAESVTATRPATAQPTIEPAGLHPIGLVLSLVLLATTAAGVWGYPNARWLLALLLSGYAVSLWWRPLAGLLVVPLALPILDLSPLTGTLLLDAFDLCVLVTLGLGYARLYPLPPSVRLRPLQASALGLLWLTWLVAMVRGLGQLPAIPGAAVESSHSTVDAWLVGKGLLWALLWVPLLRRIPAAAQATARRYMQSGLLAGLAVLTLVVLWQRQAFVGLGDFDNVYRVTGTFASMRTGGAYLEAYIAFVFPVLALAILGRGHWALKALGVALAAGAAYAMLVTYSRGGYAGLVAGLTVVGIGALRMRAGQRLGRWAGFAVIASVSLAVALPILSTGFAQQRLAIAGKDFDIRLQHWQRALDLMSSGPAAAVTGMGFGRYPSDYLLHSGRHVQTPGNYSIIANDDDPFVRLGGGEAVFLDQLVAVRPDTRYRFSARVRGRWDDTRLSVPLCEKALLYSFDCVWSEFGSGTLGGRWNPVGLTIDSGKLGAGGLWPGRPVKLSLYNPTGRPIDIDAVSLKDPNGRELVANGGFSNGSSHWLFVTDQDLAWHIHQAGVEVFYAQGLLGIAALAVLLVAVLAPLVRSLWAGSPWATLFTAALTGFITVSLLGSTLDSARSSMLFYFGSWAALLLAPRPGDGRSPPARHRRGRSTATAVDPEQPPSAYRNKFGVRRDAAADSVDGRPVARPDQSLQARPIPASADPPKRWRSR